MLYFLLNPDYSAIAAVSAQYPGNGSRFVNRNDFATLAVDEAVAAEVNALPMVKLAGATYIATDAGDYCSPRYDVICAPKVGDPISYAFNGDCYPDGHIEKISDSLRIVTSTTGNKYWRRKATGAWLKGGMWSMVAGHIDERNPHF